MTTTAQETNGATTTPIEGAHILVVDDEEMMRNLLGEILEDQGYKVATAVNGREGLNVFENGEIDLIITDVIMPEMNGVELLQATTRMDPTCPVVMMTGYPSADNAVKMVSIGAMDYIVKPFNIDLVTTTVAKVLALKKYRLSGMASPSASSDENSSMEGTPSGAEWNFEQFIKLLQTEMGRSEAKGRNFSLVVLQIDELERRAGDGGELDREELSAQFTQMLEEQCRSGDVIGRTGEREWALLLPETKREDADTLGRNVIAKADWYFSVSGGIACYPWEGDNPQALMKAARSSAEYAKAHGGGAITSERIADI